MGHVVTFAFTDALLRKHRVPAPVEGITKESTTLLYQRFD